MLLNVPVVDRAIWVACAQHQDVAIGVLGISLAVVDVVLVERLLRHHHRVSVHIHVVKEYGTTAESVIANPCILVLSEATVSAAAELPRAIALPLEDQGRVVKPATNVGILTDEHAGQDGVATVHYAFCRRLSLAVYTIGSEVHEVHLAVVTSKGKGVA